MNTDLLRTFLELAKTRHFGRAADNLFLTQSAVSSRIKQLEDMTGAALFTRSRNNIVLTTAGERLLPHAENQLVAWQLALQEVGACSAQACQLSLGGTANLWDTLLQSVLPELANQCPELFIRTEINSATELTRSLLAGRVDIAVMLDPPRNADLNSITIGTLKLRMVASKANITLATLNSVGHVFVDWGTRFNMAQARQFNEPITPVLHTSRAHIALAFLLGHGGAALLPDNLIGTHLEQGQLHPVSDTSTVSQQVYLVYAKDSQKLDQLLPLLGQIEALTAAVTGEY